MTDRRPQNLEKASEGLSAKEKVQAQARENRANLRHFFTVQEKYAKFDAEKIHPTLAKQAQESVDKIKAEITGKQKSHLENSGHVEEYIKLYFSQPIYLLANQYNEKFQGASKQEQLDLQEAYSTEVKEQTTLAIRFIQEFAKQGNGFIDSEKTAVLVEQAARFRYMLMSEQAKPLRDALTYAIRGASSSVEKDKALKDISAIALDTYVANGDDQIKGALFFTVQQLSSSERLEIAMQVKENATAEQLESFLQDANKFGAINLRQMEEVRGEQYSQADREKFNAQYSNKEDIRDTMRFMRSSYGSRNMFDISLAQTALKIGDVWALSTFALNTGIGIWKGNPLPVYSKMTGAYLLGRHLQKKDSPVLDTLGLDTNSPKVKKAERARFNLTEFYENTLEFEDWNTTLKQGGVEFIHQFGDFLTEHGKKALPTKLNARQLQQFLFIQKAKVTSAEEKAQLDNFEANFDKIPPTSREMDTVLALTRSFQDFQINKDKKGIHNLEEFNQAIALINQ